MQSVRVHADEPVLPMLESGLGRTRTARLRTYVRDVGPFGFADLPAVLCWYSPDLHGEHPQAHLADFRSIERADGYARFAGLYGFRGGFNRSSQHPCGPTADTRQMPRQASSIQGSYVAWC